MSSQYNVGYADAIGFANADLLLDFSSAAELDAELHILFIARDSAMADLYGCKLELDGYRMTFAWSQAEACQAAIHLSPDIIYLDLTKSPGWGGQVLQAIRDDPATATTPVVLLVDTVRAREVALGPHDFLIPLPDIDQELDRAGQIRKGKRST
jgi:CheY-like chemotaxis protein